MSRGKRAELAARCKRLSKPIRPLSRGGERGDMCRWRDTMQSLRVNERRSVTPRSMLHIGSLEVRRERGAVADVARGGADAGSIRHGGGVATG